jgi:putative transcriptional regulator
LRARERLSQAVLAHHLNVRTKLVSDWERGVKRPSGPSLKLLALARSKGLDAIA